MKNLLKWGDYSSFMFSLNLFSEEALGFNIEYHLFFRIDISILHQANPRNACLAMFPILGLTISFFSSSDTSNILSLVFSKLAS